MFIYTNTQVPKGSVIYKINQLVFETLETKFKIYYFISIFSSIANISEHKIFKLSKHKNNILKNKNKIY